MRRSSRGHQHRWVYYTIPGQCPFTFSGHQPYLTLSGTEMKRAQHEVDMNRFATLFPSLIRVQPLQVFLAQANQNSQQLIGSQSNNHRWRSIRIFNKFSQTKISCLSRKRNSLQKKSSFVARVVLTKHMTKARPKLELSGCFRVSMESIGRLMNIDWIG